MFLPSENNIVFYSCCFWLGSIVWKYSNILDECLRRIRLIKLSENYHGINRDGLPYSFNQRMLKVGHNEPIKWLKIVNSCTPNWSQSHHFTYRYLKDKLEPVESRKACKVLGHPSSPNLGNIGKNNWEKITSEHTDYRKYTYCHVFSVQFSFPY